MLSINMESGLSSRLGRSLKTKTWKCFTALLSMSGIRSKSQLSADTLKSAGVDPVEAKAKKDNGDPTTFYPCYPPWDEEKTFQKMNTDTGYAPLYQRKASELPDWTTEIGLEKGGEIRIGWY